jgi:dihydrodipicolinate synthase/N-acetylneuraminate lyase
MPKPEELEDKAAKDRNIIPEIIPEERLNSVKTLLCQGLDRTTILQYAAVMKWESAPGQVDAWISAAMLELADDAGNIDTEAELGKALARLNYLYMNASKVQDFKTALAIQKEINKVLVLKVKAAGAGAMGGNNVAKKFKLRIAK